MQGLARAYAVGGKFSASLTGCLPYIISKGDTPVEECTVVIESQKEVLLSLILPGDICPE